MRKLAALALLFFLTTGVALADTAPKDADAKPAEPAKPKAAKKAPAADPAAIAAELDELRQALQAQQEQIQMLKEDLSRRDRETGEAHGAAPHAKAGEAVSSSAPADASVAVSSSSATDAKSSAAMKAASAAAPAQGEPKLGPLATQKIKLGLTMFGDYAFYSDTGFGPQFITQINQPGPGNSHFNSFDITRAYLNFFYTPVDAITVRVTPNVYRQVDGTSGSIANGNNATIGGSENGNLTFRLKYAYVDFNTLFKNSEMFKNSKVTIGSTTNPLIDWEEGLSGYRYTYLVPWNYISLSSTYVGAKLHGPLEFNGKQYLDYDIGVFNTASFHAIEQTDKKQVMARLTWYPMGTKSDRTGFGISVFEDYGYNTKTPDTKSTPLNRFSAIAFYQTPSHSAQVAGEYDFGRNAMSTGNLFSGVAPAGIFAAPGTIAPIAGTVLAGDHTRQQGAAFFGHVKLGSSPFALFGLYQYFQPNTNFSPATLGLTDNPLDFSRTVGGLSYALNKNMDFAIQDSNFHYLHPQGIAGIQDTNAIFLNFQVNY